MQNNKGEFFVARGGGAGSKVADAALYHFSTNLGSVKGKSGASFMDNCKPLKRRGLRRPASRLRKAKEAAGAGVARQTKAGRHLSRAEN
jgi:hypothetical protein